jgi:hypothetical protein
MQTTSDEQLVAVADALQGWTLGLSRLGASEVLAWHLPGGGVGVALRGDALRMERSALQPEDGINNYKHHLEITLQHALGFDAQPVYWKNTNHVVGVQGGCGQLLSGDSTFIGEVVDAIETVISYALSESEDELEYVRVALMPKEGSPWEFDQDETRYYNAKKRRWLATPRPNWLIETTVRDHETGQDVAAIGADFCQLMPTIYAPPEGAGPWSMRFSSAIEPDILVTHSLDFSRRGLEAEDVAGLIEHCGGLLFPSIAVGHLPAASFGPICLLLDPMVVLTGMKPYRSRRGAWPIVTYNTDAWTSTLSGILRDGSHELYEELTGGWSPGWYGPYHFWTLGPPIVTEKGPGAERQLLLTTKRLRTALSRRVKVWHRDLTPEQIDEFQETLEHYRYPYAEAKTNGIVSTDAIVACFYPVRFEEDALTFLGMIDFRGHAIALDAPYDPYEAELKYAWSWAVQDAVRQLRGDRYIEVDV